MNGFVICGKPQFSGERVKVPLGSLGKVVTGNTPSKKNERYWATEDVPFIKPGDIDESAVTYLADGTEYIADCAIGKARCVGAGSVLVTCIGTIAKIAVVNCNCIAFNQQINAIDVDRNVIDPQYLAYALKANNTRLKMLANAPVVPIINKRQFESFVLPVHSDLNVQREIVSQFTAIGSQRQRLDEELCHLDNLVKSRFSEMFGDYESWLRSSDKKRLDELCWIGSSKRVHKNDYVSDGIPFFRSKEIVELSKGERPTTELYIERDQFERITEKNGAPAAGDLLVTAVGTIGVIWIVDGCSPFYFKDGNLLWLKPNNLEPTFLKYLLSELLSKDVDRLTGGSAYRALTIDRISQMMVVVPSPALQSEFAFFVHQVAKLRFMLLGNPSPIYRSRSFCCSTNSDNGGVILEVKDY